MGQECVIIINLYWILINHAVLLSKETLIYGSIVLFISCLLQANTIPEFDSYVILSIAPWLVWHIPTCIVESVPAHFNPALWKFPEIANLMRLRHNTIAVVIIAWLHWHTLLHIFKDRQHFFIAQPPLCYQTDMCCHVSSVCSNRARPK